MIRLENISKSYGKNLVLDDINLKLDHPGITAILGPNGSGKTTLLKCILDMVIPDEGTITFNNKNVRGSHTLRKDITYLPQIAQFPQNLSGKHIIRMIKNIRMSESNEEHLISLFGLENEIDKPMRALSGGTKQKVNLVLALMFDSSHMILDEPSTGLDPLALSNLKNLLNNKKSKDTQILVTTHIMSLVQDIADYIVFILDGKVYFNGRLEELLELQGENLLENAIANILRRTEDAENI